MIKKGKILLNLTTKSLSNSSRLCFSANEKKDVKFNIPPPQNPTMAESFGTKIEKKDLEKLLNPTGFLDPDEIDEYEGVDEDGKLIQVKPSEKSSKKTEINPEKFQTEASKAAAEKAATMVPEYGFKVKGPEPTRYGDWERKGRCSDF